LHGRRVVGRMPPPTVEREHVARSEALHVGTNALTDHVCSNGVHLLEREGGRVGVGPKPVPVVVGGGVEVLVTDARAALYK